MVKVEFLGPINLEPIYLNVKNMKELKFELNKIESLKEWLLSSAVAINDDIIGSIDIDLKDGDKISLLPPVCGG